MEKYKPQEFWREGSNIYDSLEECSSYAYSGILFTGEKNDIYEGSDEVFRIWFNKKDRRKDCKYMVRWFQDPMCDNIETYTIYDKITPRLCIDILFYGNDEDIKGIISLIMKVKMWHE